jgi:hypothetical protein
MKLGEARGALLLARAVTPAAVAEARTELELVASWLRPAVEAHLESGPREETEQVPRVSALFRVLNAAAANGREASLLRLYANALAIWHDIDLRAYIEGIDGNFRLAIALPGAVSGEAPGLLDGGEVTIGPDLTRLSSHDLEILGFRPTDEAMAARVGSVQEGTVWLLVLSGNLESAGEGRLALYTDVLRQALQSVSAASLVAVERTIWQHLVGAAERIQGAADAVLAEIRSAVGARAAALSVAVPRRGQFVRVGDLALLGGAERSRLDYLTTTIKADDEAALVVAVQGPKEEFFSSRDRQIVENIGRLLESWARGVLQRTPTAFDRRAVSRSFEDVLDETAVQAAARGAGVSVVVIRMKDTAADPRVMHDLAVQLRAQVRAGESVGVLGAGELGLLLYDTAADVARAVVGRLTPLAGASVGVAYCPPGSPSMTRLVRAAREDARGAP